ncbi:chaperonin [Culex quinquefasciatus]|uniref:Chaperonin n=1 Tax=Culex quinquefasciatus TaxID=7176 RepID=B0X1B4_CULQU|nr:chaperonin [Culex quinquefasciatus]|eukprot:XP_001863436.1 chaperonin [Culex quinquefasciatus]
MDKTLIADGRDHQRRGDDFEGGRRGHESLPGRRGWRWNDFRDGVDVRVAERAGKVARAKISPSNECGQAGGTFGAVCHGVAQLEDSVPAKLFAGCCLEDSVLDEGFLLDKKTVVHKPKRIEKSKILIVNTPMDTDKIKVFESSINNDGLDGEDCRAGGRREGEDEEQGDNQDQARHGRCDLFESLHRCDRPFQHPQDTVPEYLARRQIVAQHKAQQQLRPKVVSKLHVSRVEFGGDFGRIRGGEKVHGSSATKDLNRGLSQQQGSFHLRGVGSVANMAGASLFDMSQKSSLWNEVAIKCFRQVVLGDGRKAASKPPSTLARLRFRLPVCPCCICSSSYFVKIPA